MKTKFLLSMLLLQGLAALAAAGEYRRDLVVGGRTRTYYVHTPPQYNPTMALPVVLGLHGGGGNAAIHRVQSKMDFASNRFGYIAVYPEGTGPDASRLLTWNAGICCGYASYYKIDDVGFIRALLDDLPHVVTFDKRRVYCTGMSNGAMMSYRLACELPDRIAAICAVSASMGVDGPRPTRPVPIMEIHGLNDPNAPFDGGVGPNAMSKVEHKPVLDVMEWWRVVDQCSEDTQYTEGNDGHVIHGDEDFQQFGPVSWARVEWLPTKPNTGAPVILYALVEGGHTWPGGVDVTKDLGTGTLVSNFDANAVMWEFFRQFSL